MSIKSKKPFYKKWWFWVIVVIVVIAAFSGNEEDKQVASEKEVKQESKQVESASSETEEKKDEYINREIEVTEELNFKLFDVVVEKAKIYEKDNKILADIKISYTNRDYQYGDTKSFFVSTLFDVKQGDKSLEETNDAWDPVSNEKKSDIYFPNAAGGTTGIKLTYELIDAETPLQLEFTPTTEEEETKTIIIQL